MLVKIVYWTVPVPDDVANFTDKDIESPIFSVELPTKTIIFQVTINFKDDDKSQVGVYLSTPPPSMVEKVHCRFEFLDRNPISTAISAKAVEHTLIMDEKDLNDFQGNSWGIGNIISYKNLLGSKDRLYPDGKIMIRAEISIESKYLLNTTEVSIESLKSSKAPDLIDEKFERLVNQKDEHSIILKTSDGMELCINKQLLIENSGYYMSMFENDGFDEGINGVVEIVDFSHEAIKELLRFFQFKRVNIDRKFDLALELYKVAHRYQVDRLADICHGYIFIWVYEDNVLKAATFADLYDLPDLFRKCCSKIKKHKSTLECKPEWKKLDAEILRKIIHFW